MVTGTIDNHNKNKNIKKRKMNELKEYISVSEYAKFIGKTPAHVYNMIKGGLVSSVMFERGTMKGWLIEKPSGFDEWKQKQKKK